MTRAHAVSAFFLGAAALMTWRRRSDRHVALYLAGCAIMVIVLAYLPE